MPSGNGRMDPGGKASGVTHRKDGPLISAAELLREERLDDRAERQFSRKCRMRLRRRKPEERAQAERQVFSELTDEDFRGALEDLIRDARKEGAKEARKVRLEGTSRTSLKRLVSSRRRVRSGKPVRSEERAPSDDYDELLVAVARMFEVGKSMIGRSLGPLSSGVRHVFKVGVPLVAVPATEAVVYTTYADAPPAMLEWATSFLPAFWFAAFAVGTLLRGAFLGLLTLAAWEAFYSARFMGPLFDSFESVGSVPMAHLAVQIAMAALIMMSWKRTRSPSG